MNKITQNLKIIQLLKRRLKTIISSIVKNNLLDKIYNADETALF